MKVWQDGQGGNTPVTAAELNRIEEAVEAARNYPIDVPITVSAHAETNSVNSKTTVGTSRVPYLVLVDATNIRLVFSNFTYSSATTPPGDVTPATDYVIGGAALDYGGDVIPVMFGGQFGVTIKPGGTVVSDPVAIDVAAGQMLNVRTFTPSGTWHSVRYAVAVAQAVGGFTATTNLTLAGSAAIADGANLQLAGPVRILGTPVAKSNFSGAVRKPRVAVVGTSIEHGFNDGLYNPGFTGWSVDSKLGRGGWVDRAAVAYGFLPLKIGMANYRAQYAVSNPFTRRFSYAQIDKASNLVDCLGVNDVNNGRTLAQLQADKIVLWTMQASQGKLIFQPTLTPIANSTDVFQTLGSQSVLAGESVRVGFNEWLRDGAPMVNGVAVAVGTVVADRAKYLTGNAVTKSGAGTHPLYAAFEFADTVESSRNSGKWKVPTSNRVVTNGVAVAGNYYFTSATLALTSADVGRRLYLSAVGTAGADILTAVQAVTDPTSPVITSPIVTSANPFTARVFEPMTIDGIHPDAGAHELLKTAVPYAHFR